MADEIRKLHYSFGQERSSNMAEVFHPNVMVREVDVSHMVSGMYSEAMLNDFGYSLVGVSGHIPMATTITNSNGANMSGVLHWGSSVTVPMSGVIDTEYLRTALGADAAIPLGPNRNFRVYGPPGIKVANPEAKCPGCFFGSEDDKSHQPDCKWHDKFKPREDPLQALL